MPSIYPDLCKEAFEGVAYELEVYFIRVNLEGYLVKVSHHKNKKIKIFACEGFKVYLQGWIRRVLPCQGFSS
jgi:hypothetical protein